MKHSISMLTGPTEFQLNVTGPSLKGSGYFGYTLGQTTVAWYLNDFIGRVYVEASLATNPRDHDWFPLNLAGLNPYVQYPINPLAPTGTTGDSGIDSYTFQGNFCYIRIRIDRTYLINPNPDDVGSIDKALMNY